MNKWIVGLMYTATVTAVVASNIVVAHAATPEEILAATVRVQGMSCDRPSSAKPVRDVVTKPGKRAWILTCESGQYLIKFVRDTTAQVTLINWADIRHCRISPLSRACNDLV